MELVLWWQGCPPWPATPPPYCGCWPGPEVSVCQPGEEGAGLTPGPQGQPAYWHTDPGQPHPHRLPQGTPNTHPLKIFLSYMRVRELVLLVVQWVLPEPMSTGSDLDNLDPPLYYETLVVCIISLFLLHTLLFNAHSMKTEDINNENFFTFIYTYTVHFNKHINKCIYCVRSVLLNSISIKWKK